MDWGEASRLISALPNAHRIRRLLRNAQHHHSRWAAGDRHWEGRDVTSAICSNWLLEWRKARSHAETEGYAREISLVFERVEDVLRGSRNYKSGALNSAVLFLAAYAELGFLLDPETSVQTIKAVHAMDRSCVLIEEAVYVLKGVRL